LVGAAYGDVLGWVKVSPDANQGMLGYGKKNML